MGVRMSGGDKLGDDRSVDKLHHRMNYRFGVDDYLNFLRR